MQFDKVNDSGTREEFETGSRRDTREGKGRYDLISPHVMIRDARHMENGAVKYGDRNWEKGQPFSRFYDSAMRHMVRWMAGDRSEDHLAAARWNLACIMHFEEMKYSHLNDLPNLTPLQPGMCAPGMEPYSPSYDPSL